MPLRSLASRMTLYATSVTVAVVFMFGSVSYYFMRLHMESQVHERAMNVAEFFRSNIELVLENIRHGVESASESLVVVNALIDSVGRDVYLDPFISGFRLPGGMPFSLTLYDFEGKPISSTDVEHAIFPDSGLTRALIEEGRPVAFVRQSRGVSFLSVAYPVYYGATGLPEGFIAIRVALRDVMEQAMGRASDRGRMPLLMLMDGHGRALWKRGAVGGRTVEYGIPLRLEAPLSAMGLTLSHLESTASFTAPLLKLSLSYFGAGLLSLLIAYAASSAAAKMVSGPVMALSRMAREVAATGNPAANMKELSLMTDEVGELARSFESMLGQLAEAQGELEHKVMDRTEALEETNRHLIEEVRQRARAEERLGASLMEKEVLLKEVHHRVKNNLAVISSLLSLQSLNIESEQFRAAFRESQDRIRSMALVHEKLYQSEDLRSIDVRDYFGSLLSSLMKSQAFDRQVSPVLDVEEMEIDIDRLIPCGLIANELLTNAFKYARGGMEVRLSLRNAGQGMAVLTVSDSGDGLPEGFDLHSSRGLGFKLINALVSQLEGTLELASSNGLSASVTFPLK